MNLALAEFIASTEMGFLKDSDMPQLIALDRLCPVLVRCSCGRFTCAAQDVPGFVKLVSTGIIGDGDKPGQQYVRDVSVTSGVLKDARGFMAAHKRHEDAKASGKVTGDAYVVGQAGLATSSPQPTRIRRGPGFDESQCGGVFDGHGVVSDADPGM